jgi:hypothetical protein
MTFSIDGDIEDTSMMCSTERVMYFITMPYVEDGINVDVR